VGPPWESKVTLRRRRLAWLPAFLWLLLFAYAVWPWIHRDKSSSHTIVFFGFSILGDVMTGSIFPSFQRNWENRTGQKIEFIGSFSGSGTVVNQLIMGVPAQMAALSLEPDAERLSDRGLTPKKSWLNLPYKGVLNRTPFIILVRPGNPKNIRDFSDLARTGVKIVHPDPLTSGAANWAILAEYGSAMRQNPGQPNAGYDLLLGIWRNVIAQAHSARSARAHFENGFGDALITYEQEALSDQAQGKLPFDIIYPASTILSEPILVVLPRSIHSDEHELINALVVFLWSSKAQSLFVSAGFRSVDESINETRRFKKIFDPFSVQELGGWEKAQKEIIDGVWKNRVLKELGRRP
jgi:sulfate/thiosulfate transport system substrate-binding protein